MSDLTNLQPTSKDCKALIPVLISFFQDFQSKYEKNFAEMKQELLAATNVRDQQIETLQREVCTLKEKVKKMENLADESDAYERRDTVIFAGPAIPASTPQENCAQIIQKVVKDELKINISANDFNAVHRIGPKPPNQAPDKRNIIVKFCRRDLKRDILKASKSQQRPVRVFVNESLTPPRRKIFNVLRQVKREHPELVRGVSTYEGRVFAYTKNDQPGSEPTRDRRHLVNSYDMLSEFFRDYVRKPIGSFLDSWTY